MDELAWEQVAMATIVIITSEMAGRINISAELSRRLTQTGHRVIVACPVDIGAQVAAHGAVFADLATRPAETAARSISQPSRRRDRAIDRLRQITVRRRREAAAAAIDPDGFLAALDGLDPDLTLIDIELPMHIIAAAGNGRTIALWTSMLSVWKRPGLPPLHTAIVPGVGNEGSRLGIEWSWLRFRIGKWISRLRRRITQMGADRISVLRIIADRAGFSLRDEISLNGWLVPFVYRSLPTLSFNAQELEFPHDPQPNCRYVGPMLTPEISLGAEPDLLAKVYARRTGGETEALIYCSFGAWHKGDDADFFRRVVAAVAAHPEWEAVMGLGGRIDATTLGDIPPNVHVLDWAPQLDILQHADVAVHHAGISSVNECITSGVPMVLYPFDFLDQRGNAARVMFHRLGEVGNRTTDTQAVIRSRIERTLADGEIRRSMDTMRTAFAGYQRNDCAVVAIEALL